MTKEMKQYLETVVTSIVNEDTDGAKAAFHDYLKLKTQSILEGKDEEGSGEEGSGDEGSGEGSGKGEDESSGKPAPFKKKEKKDEE